MTMAHKELIDALTAQLQAMQEIHALLEQGADGEQLEHAFAVLKDKDELRERTYDRLYPAEAEIDHD